jgi:hypothetical protein
VVEGDVLDAEEAAEDLDGELVILNAGEVLAELLDHDLLDDRLDHPNVNTDIS